MNISIDIDGCLVDRESYQIQKAIAWAKQKGLNHEIINPSGYNVHEIFGWSKNDFLDFWNEFLWDYSKLPPIEQAKEVLTKLKADGHKIIINTSRWLSERNDEVGEKMRETVKNWFEKHKIPYDELVFACGDKISGVKKFEADVHIEDSQAEAKPIAKLVPVIIFHASYNENMSGENLMRAKSWNEVYKHINTLGNSLSK